MYHSKTCVLLGGPDDGHVEPFWWDWTGFDGGITYNGGGHRPQAPEHYYFSFEENGVRYYIHESEAKFD